MNWWLVVGVVSWALVCALIGFWACSVFLAVWDAHRQRREERDRWRHRRAYPGPHDRRER